MFKRNVMTVLSLVLPALWAGSARAAGGVGIGSLIAKVNALTDQAIALGGTLSVLGFVWALLGVILGFGGTHKAVMVIICGLLIATAPQIVGHLIN